MYDRAIEGILLAIAPAGREEEEAISDRLGIIGHKLKFIGDRPSVLVISSLESLQAADGIIAELVNLAGGRVETELTANPDILVIADSGSPIPKTLGALPVLTGMAGWTELGAVKNGRVFVANAAAYFKSNGETLADTAEILAEIIHPKQFVFGFEGNGWIKFG